MRQPHQCGLLALQGASHFAEVGRIVGIEAAPARRRLDGALGRDQY
jgi:hypothetical protein